MSAHQSGILTPLPQQARYLEFDVIAGATPQDLTASLEAIEVNHGLVVGLGHALAERLRLHIGGLRPFPQLSNLGIDVPSTQHDLWAWVKGEDRGEILHRARHLEQLVAPVCKRTRLVDGFKYAEGRDLSGYEDGTENPKDDAAAAAAIDLEGEQGPAGSSFVVMQKWKHNLDAFFALPQEERDDIIGRRRSDNEELDEAPPSAHVKRTAQESFEPEAFLLRRSMPWADRDGEGLNFVAFGHAFDAFEVQMRRMMGLDDGVLDGLFRFSAAITGAYYWCPPQTDGRLDLSNRARSQSSER